MNDKDAQLIWEAAPTEWPPPKATIVPERPTEADLLVQLQRQAQRIDVLQWEVDQLKTVMDKNNLKSLIVSIVTTVFPWVFAHQKTRKR